jgi:VanZ family protein
MRTQRFLSLIAWAVLAFVAFATLSPYSLRPELTETEPSFVVTLEHIGAFGLVGFLFFVSYPDRIRATCLVTFGSAAAFELGQAFLPDRHARFGDVLEKFAGGGAGLLLGIALLPVLVGPNGVLSKIDQQLSGSSPPKRDSEVYEFGIGLLSILLLGVMLVLFQRN